MASFRILEWMNYSDNAIEHYERMLSAPPKLSGRLIFGDDAPERQRNSQRNLVEHRTIFWMITAERPKSVSSDCKLFLDIDFSGTI